MLFKLTALQFSCTNSITMQLFFLLFCVSYVSGFYIDDTAPRKEKIFGGYGVKAWYKNYQATLEYLQETICGAVIISKDHLLSAAHCLLGLVDPLNNVKIRAGTADKSEHSGQVFNLTKIQIHEHFYESDSYYINDIVLLWASLEFNENIDYILMLKYDMYPPKGSNMLISGFGKMENSTQDSSYLKEALVNVISESECPFEVRHLGKVVCATSYPNDKCKGDAGGPGVIEKKLATIISSESPCGDKNSPGVYMNVGSFYTWIMRKGGDLIFYYQNCKTPESQR